MTKPQAEKILELIKYALVDSADTDESLELVGLDLSLDEDTLHDPNAKADLWVLLTHWEDRTEDEMENRTFLAKVDESGDVPTHYEDH